MVILFWVLSGLAFMGMLGCLAAVLRVRMHCRPVDEIDRNTLPSVSMLVPIKGADDHTAAHLTALVESDCDFPVEFLFAMETQADPAYEICRGVQQAHPEREVHILLTGAANGRMGKQHNLAGAVKQAKYEVIGAMDADVCPEPDTLRRGVLELQRTGGGTVFSLPYYSGTGRAGGLLVALYTNYYFSLYIGSLAAGELTPLTIGSMWWTTRSVLDKIGGFERFTGTVSDDAAIGKAVAEAGMRNVLSRKPVKLAFEPLSPAGGFRHLQKWVAMLRAEGLGRYLSIALTWHFVSLALLAAGAGWLAQRPLGLAVLAASILVRVGSVLALNGTVYRGLRRTRFALAVIGYELVVVPVLFGIGLFKRSLIWRGRKYVIGSQGRIEVSGEDR